jgi:hypothetical protein
MQTTDEANTTNTNNATTNNNADNNNNNANMTLGDCARLLVAARLPLLLQSTPEGDDDEEAPPPPLSFEALLEALRQRPLVAAAGRLFAAFVALADGGGTPPTTTTMMTERRTRTLLTAGLIAAHPINVFEFPAEPLEAALSAATAPFLRTFGRLVVAVATSALWAEGVEQGDVGDEEIEQQLLRQILLLQPFGLLATATAELPQQMAAFEAAHAAWSAADVPRLVRRICLSLLALAQARTTVVADHHHNDDDTLNLLLVAQFDTSIDRLRTQLVRLDGGAEALAAIDAAVGDGAAAADLLMRPDLNLVVLPPNNDDNNNNADDA